jgi:hypothetical protein
MCSAALYFSFIMEYYIYTSPPGAVFINRKNNL